MRGDLEISDVKLANLLGAEEVGTAHHNIVEEVTKAPVGFAGPINLFDRERVFGGKPVQYFFDHSVEGLKNFLCGGNEEDVHYIGVNTGRDFPAPDVYHDLSKVKEGLACPKCREALGTARGIELGHIFQLQQVYSDPMGAVYTDPDGNDVPYWMGCYGIGVSRMVQAIAEQHYDERGIIWPMAMAPYKMVVIPVNPKMLGEARIIYSRLAAEFGEDNVMLDDRGERFGVAITDAELIGYPIQLVVGRSWDSNKELEVRLRDQRDNGKHFDPADNPDCKPAFMRLEDFSAWFRLKMANGKNK
jgi:prolyl-tRNA synthetase